MSITHPNTGLMQEFMALRDKTSVLEINTQNDHGSARKMVCDTDETISYLELANASDGLRLEPQGALQFCTDIRQIRLQWVDAQPLSSKGDSVQDR